MICSAWRRLLRPTPSPSSPPESFSCPAAGVLRRAAAAFLLGLPLLLGPVAGAQAQTASLVLDPTEIGAESLDGATITLIPKNSTFLAAGGGGSGDIGVFANFHPDTYDHNNELYDASGEIGLSATGLAKITLSGAPAGLTIASGKLLAREQPHSHGGGTNGHRSAEITLAYSGPAITVDDPVTVTVGGGGSSGLLRWGKQNGANFPPNLSADFTIRAGGVSVSRESLTVGENQRATYTVVLKRRPAGNVTISATSGATATATVSPGTLTFTNSNWNRPKTFTVTGRGAGSTSIGHAVSSSADTAAYPTSTTIPPVSVTVVTPQPLVDLSLIWTASIPAPPDPPVVGGRTNRKVAKEVSEGDSGTTDVSFYVRTERLHSSKLPFRVCASGNATQDTTGSPEVDDDYQLVVDGAVQGRCVSSSIPANQRFKQMTIRILNDDRYEGNDGESLRLELTQAPGNPLPYPWRIASSESGYDKLSLRIADDDYWQRPVQFSPAEYEDYSDERVTIPRSQTRRASEKYSGGKGVGVMFTRDTAAWGAYTVTYKVVHAESTATYGNDYTLAHYNRHTNRGTIRVPQQGGAALWVNVVDDNEVEGEEKLVIEMVSVDGDARQVDTSNDRHKLSFPIDDNDNPAYLRVSPERTTLSADGAEQRITMSAGVPLPVDVHFEYCVEEGVATPGTDYELTGPDGAKVAGTGCHLATLPAGSAGIDLVVRMLDGDDRIEPDEKVKIRLRKSTVPGRETASSTVAIKILPSTVEKDKDGNEVNMAAIVTLKDDDMPTLEVVGQRGAGQDGDLVAFTVRAVNGPFDRTLTFDWELDDPGDLINGDRKTVTTSRECTQFLRDLGVCTGNTHTYTVKTAVHRQKSGSGSLARGRTEVEIDFLVRGGGPDGSVTFTASERKSYRLVSGKGSACVAIRGGACSGGQGGSDDTVAPPRPTAAVANVQVAAVDATSATVTWDAVEHATSYRVAYEGTAGDPQNSVSGSVDGHTDTTWTFDHNAAEAMTVTVTVTPEYVDGNGDTQQLAALAGTATLDVAPAGTQDTDTQTAQAHGCDLASVKADVAGYVQETHYGAAHVARWKQALAGLNEEAGGMTAAGARQMMAKYSPGRWQPVVDALDCLEAAAQPETPAAVPEVTVSGGGDITEGGDAVFTVEANPAPQSDLDVTLTVADDGAGDFLGASDEGAHTVTIQAGQTSATLTLSTVNDSADEANGGIAATIQSGSGYTVAVSPDHTATVAVSDDDDAPVVIPVVSISGGGGITEGGDAVFTLTAAPAPSSNITVRMEVTDSGAFASSGQTGARDVTIGAGGTATLTVSTENDGVDEANGGIAATIQSGSGYTVAASPDETATVSVSDDDAAAGLPALSVNDVTVQEGPYRRVEFTVTLNKPAPRTGAWFHWRVRESTPVSARRNKDFWASSDKTFASMKPGQTEYRIRAALVLDDSHDEDPETFEIVLSDATHASIADGVGVATIVNSDPMPAAWLSRFGRTVAEQAIDGIANRMAAPRATGVEGAIAGQAVTYVPGSGSGKGGAGARRDREPYGGDAPAGGVSFGGRDSGAFGGSGHGARFSGHDAFGPDAFGFGNGGERQSQSMTLSEALLGSSFAATGARDGAGGSLAFWGRGSQSSFDGREGTFSLDGEATTGMLGADYARGDWLMGLALMQSSGKGGYADTGISPRPASQACPEGVEAGLCDGAVRTGGGKVEASLNAAVPYAALQASERIRLWGSLGYGTGEVTVKPSMGGSLKSDITWNMAAAGGRGDIIAPPTQGSGPSLALTSDALWARTSSEKTRELAASESDVTRLRLGLEGGYRVPLEEGGQVTPKVEVGMRHDGGDAETGAGVDIGGGVAWDDPTLGLSLDLSGRTLIAHGDDDLEDRGFAASLAFDPDPATKRGPSLSLRQDWGGQAEGGLDALFAPAPLEDRTGSEQTSRWSLETAYGFPAFGGRFTGSPHAGLEIATGTRGYTLGWRLTPESANAPDRSFGLKAARRENDTAEPEHTFGFEFTSRW